MKVLVSGSRGLVGSALVPALARNGHFILRLVRRPPEPRAPELLWNPGEGILEREGLQGIDAVVHLAGESVAGGTWTAEQKARIRNSRVGGTALLCDTLATLDRPPKVLVSASATGYYGDRGDEILREESVPGTGFLAGVCREWEAATEPAVRKGIRVVLLRIGMVLSPAGGALGKMLPLFRSGLGGKLGSGRQYVSWIALDDLVGSILHVLSTPSLEGPVNAVAPHPLTNREFTKALGRAIGRPAVLPVPSFAARLTMGEMADELLLASTRVEPSKLISSGYRFLYPAIDEALRHLLFGKGSSRS